MRDRKTGFCLRDSYGPARLRAARVPPRFTGNCGQRQKARSSVEMGTSVGYTDRYPAHFHGQSLDLTGVAAGEYVLVQRTNAAGLLRELRLDNNAASLRLRLTWPRGPQSRISVLRDCGTTERCLGLEPASAVDRDGRSLGPGAAQETRNFGDCPRTRPLRMKRL